MLADKRKDLAVLFSVQHEAGWLIVIRVLFLITSLLSALALTFQSQTDAHRLWFVFGPIALLLGFCVVSAVWLMKRKPGRAFVYVQLVVDMLTITGIIYVSGGPLSPFLFLYLPLVMASAIFCSRRESLAVAVLSIFCYSALIMSMLHGLIPAADGHYAVQTPSNGLLIQILQLLSAMVLTAIGTGYLRRQVVQSNAAVEQARKDIFEISNRQHSMIDSMPEGIIVTKIDNTILSINSAGAILLSVLPEQVISRKLTNVLLEIDNSFDPDLFMVGGASAQHELYVSKANSDDHKTVVYHGKPLYDADGTQNGVMYVFQDVTQLRSVEEQLRMQERLARLLANHPEEEIGPNKVLRDFVGESAIMLKIFALIEKVAKTDATVLISGESGTGKELVARAIHKSSPRANAAFVAVNCGAIPENLIESELFGHKKGAFTSADADASGLFRQAEGGTIFLDEIGELPLHVQSKLLRAIQEKSVRPIGGTHNIPVNVRIVAASNRNLKEEVSHKRFREDLFYRLNVISIKLPPLRNRKSDIPLLLNSIFKNLLRNGGTPLVSPEAMKLLMLYDYPGNVRELENIIERSLVLGGEVILAEHLPDVVRNYKQSNQVRSSATSIIVDETIQFPMDLDAVLGMIERQYIEAALLQAEGVKKRAADLLGMNFRSFRYRLQKFDLEKSNNLSREHDEA